MLDKQDLETLARPFAVQDHEFLNGLIYLREDDVTERLDEVDPNWIFEIISVSRGDSQVTVHARLTVKDITRDGVGMHVIATSKSGNEVGEAEKSAATDALKRAARLFGVGRYLLKMKGITNHAQLAQALNGKPQSQSGGSDKAATPPAPQAGQGGQKPANTWADKEAAMTVFNKKVAELEKLGCDRLKMITALGVEWRGNWQQTMLTYTGDLPSAVSKLIELAKTLE